MFPILFIILTAGLILYYAVMIVLDINKANNTENAKTAADETEIDISAEEGGYMPTEVKSDHISDEGIVNDGQEIVPMLVEEAYIMAESVAEGDLSADMSQFAMELLA